MQESGETLSLELIMNKSKVEIFIDACGLSEDLSMRKEFLREVLEYCKKSKTDSNAITFIQALNRAVRVPGFRSFEHADMIQKINVLTQKLKRSRSLFKEIIDLWSSANSDLMDKMYMHILSLIDSGFRELREKVFLNEGHDELAVCLDGFIEKNPKLDRNKSQYALYYTVLFDEGLFDHNDDDDGDDHRFGQFDAR